MSIDEILFADIASNLGDRAFPVTISREGKTATGTGCTKRELFAAMAMQGMLATTLSGKPEDYATDAVTMADALLSELAKSQSK